MPATGLQNFIQQNLKHRSDLFKKFNVLFPIKFVINKSPKTLVDYGLP